MNETNEKRKSFNIRGNVNPSLEKRPSFTINTHLSFTMDFTLAMELSDLILAAKTENKALQAFALQLQNMGGAPIDD